MDTNVYKTKLGSLEATVKLFSPNITQGYASDDDLKADLTEAATLLVIKMIKSSTHTHSPDNFHIFACRNVNPATGANVKMLNQAGNAGRTEQLSGNFKNTR